MYLVASFNHWFPVKMEKKLQSKLALTGKGAQLLSPEQVKEGDLKNEPAVVIEQQKAARKESNRALFLQKQAT